MNVQADRAVTILLDNTIDYMNIPYENSFFSLNMENPGSSTAVWLTVKEEDGRRSFWNVKYFRAAGLGPIAGRQEMREDGGGGLKVRKMRKETVERYKTPSF